MIPLWLQRLFLYPPSACPTESATQPRLLIKAGSLCVATALQIVIAITGKITQLELVLSIVIVHQCASVTCICIARPAISDNAIRLVFVRISAASRLHTASCRETRDGIRWRTVESRAKCWIGAGVFAR